MEVVYRMVVGGVGVLLCRIIGYIGPCPQSLEIVRNWHNFRTSPLIW
jgi:hypothetical protein